MTYVMTQIEADQKVEDSARVLDVEFPGWEDELDVGYGFSINSPEHCPLKQLGGDYSTAFTSLLRKRSYNDGLQGFACYVDEDEMFVLAWRNEVEKRKTDNRTEFLTERVTNPSEIPVTVTDRTLVPA